MPAKDKNKGYVMFILKMTNLKQFMKKSSPKYVVIKFTETIGICRGASSSESISITPKVKLTVDIFTESEVTSFFIF